MTQQQQDEEATEYGRGPSSDGLLSSDERFVMPLYLRSLLNPNEDEADTAAGTGTAAAAEVNGEFIPSGSDTSTFAAPPESSSEDESPVAWPSSPLPVDSDDSGPTVGPEMDEPNKFGIPILPSEPANNYTSNYPFNFTVHLPNVTNFTPEEAEEVFNESVDWTRQHKLTATLVALVWVAFFLSILRCIYLCRRDARIKAEQKSFDTRSAQAHMLLGEMQLLPSEDPDEPW